MTKRSGVVRSAIVIQCIAIQMQCGVQSKVSLGHRSASAAASCNSCVMYEVRAVTQKSHYSVFTVTACFSYSPTLFQVQHYAFLTSVAGPIISGCSTLVGTSCKTQHSERSTYTTASAASSDHLVAPLHWCEVAKLIKLPPEILWFEMERSHARLGLALKPHAICQLSL